MSNNGITPQIKILNLETKTKAHDVITVARTSVTIPAEIAERMQIKTGDFLLIGNLGTNVYIAKKPHGIFGGHRLYQKEKHHKFIASLSMDKYSVAAGHYKLGQEIPQTIKSHDGKDVQISFFEIQPI